MPRIDDEDRRNLKEEVWLMIQQNRGIRTKEIAVRLNVQIRRLNNYLRELRDEGKIIQEGWSWESNEFNGPRLYRFELLPVEVITLYLGARLLVKQHDHRNQPAESALRKLAAVLRSDAPIGKEIEQVANELAQRNENRQYQSIFRTVAESYAYRNKIKMVYKPLGEKAFETVFETYLIEPSLVGAATYIIGKSSIDKGQREHSEYKLGRIQSVEKTNEDYTVPGKYQNLDVMRDAWSVIGGEAKVEVKLRFAPSAVERIEETKWHAREQTFPDPEKPGWLRWEATVPNILDMIPWVMGWGAQVEVIEPQWLFDKVKKEARELAALYRVLESKTIQKHWLLWAKTSKEKKNTDQYHPLLCHLIDVGQVARLMWQEVLTATTRSQLAAIFSLSEPEAERLIAFTCAVHDIGKASPSFQMQNKPGKARLMNAGFYFAKELDRCRHEAISHLTLVAPAYQSLLLQSPMDWGKEAAEFIAGGISGHHGKWLVDLSLKSDQIGDGLWDEVRNELFLELCRIFNPPKVTTLQQKNLTAALVIISGLISVADWIGSRQDSFPFASSKVGEVDIDVNCYVQLSAERAYKALYKLNWLDWQTPNSPMPFNTQFAVKGPRAMQSEIIKLAEKQLTDSNGQNQPESTIVIIEDATGSGKTEAALYLADHWSALLKHRGAYVAMPTMATSNSMHKRYNDILRRRYPTRPNLQLAHSQAAYQDADLVDLHEIGDSEKDDEPSKDTTKAENWFAPRKRTLLSTFGVGTVDQALMSVLQTKHFFVRLMALANKTVIFDEVHAYDAHMSAIFRLTLTWLRALGSSVVVLSATLPLNTRQNLLSAYLGDGIPQVIDKDFPSVVWANGNDMPQVVKFTERPQDRTMQLKYIGRESADIAMELREVLKKGGCAVVICNRVKRAQDVYKFLEQTFENEIQEGWLQRDDLMLFHARFPMDERKKIEDKVLEKFGKPTRKDDFDQTDRRPKRAILVATQVVEQSLDLDFDVMISDLAPIDLLIQRVGRLWRHERKNRPVNELVLRITTPEETGEIPKFGKDGFVYKPYTLFRTWLELQRQPKPELTLPFQTRDLIEAIYGSEGEEMPDASMFPNTQQVKLQNLWRELCAKDGETEYKAGKQLIPPPSYSVKELLTFDLEEREEDNLTVNNYWRAQTRDILPSVSLICLHRVENGLAFDAKGEFLLRKEAFQKPDKTTVKALMGRVITVTNPLVVDFFTDLPGIGPELQKLIKPTAWEKHGSLRSCRVAIFRNSIFKFVSQNKEYVLKLTEQLGLEVEPVNPIQTGGESKP